MQFGDIALSAIISVAVQWGILTTKVKHIVEMMKKHEDDAKEEKTRLENRIKELEGDKLVNAVRFERIELQYKQIGMDIQSIKDLLKNNRNHYGKR